MRTRLLLALICCIGLGTAAAEVAGAARKATLKLSAPRRVYEDANDTLKLNGHVGQPALLSVDRGIDVAVPRA